MRTTLTIDDDVLAVARDLAERNGISLGSAISELARRGFRSGSTSHDGLPMFRVADNAAPITSDDVYRGLSDVAR